MLRCLPEQEVRTLLLVSVRCATTSKSHQLNAKSNQEAISTGRGWFTPVVVRSTWINAIRGGWSAMLAVFVRRHLLGADGLATVGCPLTVSGRPVLLYASLTNLLSDGEGLKYALSWKGASGLKPCCKHHNVYKKDDAHWTLAFAQRQRRL